ncbi:MAG: rhomboid family intramembrane serine protease [Spirochaetota bacterium]|nr:rhomboid family intramembrane serine protease [Spirochaetota bacterium]
MNTSNTTNRTSPFVIMIYVLALLWLITLASLFLPINNYGIIPRNISGLKGVIFSPFIHSYPFHLIANSLSLYILGIILISLERNRTILIIVHIIIWGGLGTWLIGRGGTVHVGSSGVIYGIMGYLFSVGIFNRNFKTIIISLITFFLYGGAIWGIFPSRSFISWEAHLCGLISGVMIAKMYSKSH